MWHMTLCPDSKQEVVEATFSDRKSAHDWLEENYPALLSADQWRSEREDFFQYGMNYFWASFQWVEDE